MPQISELLASLDHCRLSDCTLQYILCEKEVCNICVWIDIRIRTTEIDVGVYNICEEFLRWLDFPVENPMDKYHFLTLTDARTYNDSYNISLGNILEIIPDSRRSYKELTHLAEAKVVDSDYALAASKVRAILYCDVCNVPLWIYSKRTVGKSNGPRKLQACVLDQFTDSGCTYGREGILEGFYEQ